MKQDNAFLNQQVSPDGLLAAYVDCFWTLKAPAHLLPERERRPADGRLEVVFHFEGPTNMPRLIDKGRHRCSTGVPCLGNAARAT